MDQSLRRSARHSYRSQVCSFGYTAVTAWAFAGSALLPAVALADEGGASFWLPGQFSSFAAVPVDPGWSLGSVYYHTSASEGASKDFIIGGKLTAGVHARGDLVFIAPTYTFTQPLLGGQAALAVVGAVGRMRVGANVGLTGPNGNTIGGSEHDSKDGGSDLYPLGTLKWHDGTNNYMAYTMLGIPTGAYQVGRLANIGLNHWSIDAGGGYTYLDPSKGHELSAVAGLTYNFENNDTDYRNGVDFHLDWAMSQFLSEQWHVGLVGYFYHQLSGDSGSGATLGEFKSGVNGAGPEVGYFFPFGEQKAYVQLKNYWEWGAQNRPQGWNVWLALSLPLGGAGK